MLKSAVMPHTTSSVPSRNVSPYSRPSENTPRSTEIGMQTVKMTLRTVVAARRRRLSDRSMSAPANAPNNTYGTDSTTRNVAAAPMSWVRSSTRSGSASRWISSPMEPEVTVPVKSANHLCRSGPVRMVRR